MDRVYVNKNSNHMNLGMYCIVNIRGIKYVNKVFHNKQHNEYGKLLFVSKRNEPSCNALFIIDNVFISMQVLLGFEIVYS